MGTRIKDAALVGSLSEGYKIPVSDGSNQPKTASVGHLSEFVNQKYGVEQKLSELGSKVSSITNDLHGGIDIDITNTIIWSKGVWNYEENNVFGADFIKQTYRCSNKIDISAYDEVKLSGLLNGSPMSASGSTVPTITFFGNGEPIGWKMYQNGEAFEINHFDYKDYDKLEIVLNAFQSEETYVPSIKVMKEGGLSKDVKDLEKESASVGETVSKLETSILGVDNVDIADSLTWTKGCWNFTSNSGGGSSYTQQTYRYSNKIDISNYDEVKLNGLWYGASASTKDNVNPTITFFWR